MNENILKEKGRKKNPLDKPSESLSFLDEVFEKRRTYKPKKMHKQINNETDLTEIIGLVDVDNIDSNDHEL